MNIQLRRDPFIKRGAMMLETPLYFLPQEPLHDLDELSVDADVEVSTGEDFRARWWPGSNLNEE